MRPCTTLPACKLCGSASSKTLGGGPTAAARRSATGGGLSPTTLKVRIVSLPYLYMKGSGMTCPALAIAGSSAKGVSWCCSDRCKTETFIACVLSPSIVTLAAMKYSSTTSPAHTQDATTTAFATSPSTSSQGVVTYHFTVTNRLSTTQTFTSGLTTVSGSTVTVSTALVSSTSTADIYDASSATTATTTLATPVDRTSIQPTTSSTALDSGDKKIIRLWSPLLWFSMNSHFAFFMLPS